MNYLFIGSHCDDVELSCGGTITRLIEENHLVTVITLSFMYENSDLLEEWKQSMNKLGVHFMAYRDFQTRLFHEKRQEILDYFFTLKGYDYVFTHSKYDIHSDHSTVGKEAERAFKHTNLLSFTGTWNHPPKPDYFVKLNSDHIETKRVALKCYESQKNRAYMSSDYIWANALNTGVICGTKYAEGFNVVNLIQ